MKKLISLILVLVLFLSNFTLFEVSGITVENDETFYSGGSGTLSDPYKISNIEDLQDIRRNLDKHFIQTQNIDLSSIDDWTPIGTSSTPFTGLYNGNGYSIKNLKILSGSENIGLFGYIGSESLIKNINIIEPFIDNTNIRFVGSLVGYSNGGTIENCSTINGSITADQYVGGLIGVAKSSSISKSFFTGAVEADNDSVSKVGGLVGYTNYISSPTDSTIIDECYAYTTTTGGQYTGGLVGDNKGIVINSFSSGTVRGTSSTGGLIGLFNHVSNESTKIENCYSTSFVEINSGTHIPGGLIGSSSNDSFITSSFWDSELTGIETNSDGLGLNTTSMQDEASYTDWDFDNIWAITDITNNGYPYLVNLPKQKLKISGDFSVEDKEYDGTNKAAISSENLMLSGIFIDEDSNNVKLNPIASFSSQEIGNNKTVGLSNSYLTGKFAFLYEIDFTDSPTAFGNIYRYADYTKVYYVQGLDDGEYTTYRATTESGLIGESTTISSISIDGFTENINHPESKVEGEISIDDTLVLKRFYDRNIYSVTFINFDGSIIDTQKVRYGGTAVSPPYNLREGYEFLRWNKDFNDVQNNLTVTATWKAKGDVIYTVNHYAESLDGNYTLNQKETYSGTTNTTASAVTLELDGFIFNEMKSITSGKITADGSLELNLYYDKNLYSVTFLDYDGSIINTQKIKYEGDAILPENPYRSGYRFLGWNGTYQNITEDTIIVTKYIKRKSKSSIKDTTDEESKDKILKIQVPSVENHWSEEAVKELVSRKIIINYDAFQPEENITRGEFADYITRALDLYEEDNTYKINFYDIDDEHILSDSVKSALEHGIIKGYKDKTFRPDQTITRQEAMVMYARAINILGIKLSEYETIANYKDSSKIGGWAFNDVRIVVSAGIFRGTNEGTLSPLSTFKYSEAAESIRNLLYIESTQ